MRTETKTTMISAPAATGLGGAVRRAAVMLLAVMLTTATAWAQYSTIYLSLDKNDGSGIVNAFPVSYDYINGNYNHTLSATYYTREGHSITGWSSGPTTNARYGANETIVLTESLTLYAIWDDTTTSGVYSLSIPSAVTATIGGNSYTNTSIGVNKDETVSLSYTGDVADGKSVHYKIIGMPPDGVTVHVTYPGTNNADGKSAILTMPAFDITLTMGTPNDFAIPSGIIIEEEQDIKGSLLHAIIDGSSLETISVPTAISVSSVTLNRTFTPGKPATVMLPFDYKCAGENHEGGKFYSFDGVEQSGAQWIATMKEVGDGANSTSTLTANTPYIFMPTRTKIDFFIFNQNDEHQVTLCTTGGGNQQTADAGSHWTFKGTYAYKEWKADGSNSEEIGRAYGFAGVAKDGISVGDFVRVASGAKIRPMSCYLLWSDTPNAARTLTRGAAGADELPQSITVRLVSSVGETTAIGTLDTQTGELDFEGGGWYDMSGRRLNGKPSQKGMYINNGKKVIVK